MIVIGSSHPSYGQVVLQKDHADLAQQLAKAFGNKHFEAAEPRDLMEFLALNHDRGWDETDRDIQRNPKTGLPFSLVQTPLDELLQTGPRSVAFNAQFHPYCGILSAMHVWGLFHGRYGMSDKVVMNLLQGEAKVKADTMLGQVKKLEQQWVQQLANDPEYSGLVAEKKLMQNYQLLQFFDTLSLYFNESAGQEGNPASFLNVPQNQDSSETIQITPLGLKTFRVKPYPFALDALILRQKVYEIPVLSMDVDYQHVFVESSWRIETLTLVS